MSSLLQALDSWRDWLGLVLVAWLVVAAVTGVWVGWVVRSRDEQVPTDTVPIPTCRKEG